MIIAVVNNKGGVGKTTTAVNLGAALASPSRRVLLIDLDSQASASVWCGVPRRGLKPSSANCLLHNYPIAQAVRRTATRNLDIVTGSAELANVDVALCNVAGRETTLKGVLRVIRQRYDIVVLDCPPSLSLIGVNALMAAEAFIVPVTPQYLAAEGLVSLLHAVEQVRERLAWRGRLLGILLTMVEGKSAIVCQLRDRLRGEYGDRVFRTEISLSAALQKAPARGQPIVAFAPRSSPAREFRRLSTEVLERLRAVRRVPALQS